MMKRFSIALAQINPTVGDIAGNAALLATAYDEAHGADIIIAPELALTGYPPEDLILMPHFRKCAMAAAHELAKKTAIGAAFLFGSIWEEDGKVYNAALLAEGGKIVHVQPKTMLPNYGVFDEKRVFSAGSEPHVCHWRGAKLGILVCEDMWHAGVADALKKDGAEILLVINASPFEAGKLAQRHKVAAGAATRTGLPLAYVNLVGGQDDIVFDGGSFVMDAGGAILMQMPEFQESVMTVMRDGVMGTATTTSPRSTNETLWNAMKLALADYVRKNGFSGVLLGLSGGIDSAISVALAVDALGAENVQGVLLPSPYSSQGSIDDALESAKLLGIKTDTISIAPFMQTAEASLTPVFGAEGWMDDIAVGGNLQARIRGQILMALSNQTGRMLLSTGNKSEIAVGYSTLYGDSCGAYCVIKDLYKTEVYTLAKWRNSISKVIPQSSIDKAPSAELKPGQRDDDQLPPYDILDAILQLHIEKRQSAEEIIAQKFDAAVVKKILHLVRISEYKRRQSCPGVKLSPMLFGKDRRYSLTNKF
ncbi:MAG: NAD+ synthase [Alphaproteobacteria bacterium]|nr:NAD+ synthase [Alphaproteobacteria bacterium]